MSNELVVKEYSENDIKKYICPNATEQEFFTFCQIVKARNLNPFLKEVHFVKYGTGAGQIVVGKDAIIKRAKKSPGYKGFKAGWFNDAGEKLDFPIGKIMGAWCEVYSEGNETLFISVLSSEYSSNQSTWKAKPATMIRKVAVVQAHREFSPEETSGLYDADELGDNKDITQKTTPENSETKDLKEALKPKETQKAKPATWAEKLKSTVDLPEYKTVCQSLLKSGEIMAAGLRATDEETAERVFNLLEKTKGFEDADKTETQPEDIESHF